MKFRAMGATATYSDITLCLTRKSVFKNGFRCRMNPRNAQLSCIEECSKEIWILALVYFTILAHMWPSDDCTQSCRRIFFTPRNFIAQILFLRVLDLFFPCAVWPPDNMRDLFKYTLWGYDLTCGRSPVCQRISDAWAISASYLAGIFNSCEKSTFFNGAWLLDISDSLPQTGITQTENSTNARRIPLQTLPASSNTQEARCPTLYEVWYELLKRNTKCTFSECK